MNCKPTEPTVLEWESSTNSKVGLATTLLSQLSDILKPVLSRLVFKLLLLCK